MIRKLLFLAALLSLAALALGFTGRLHPLGDSLAVFRLPILGLSCLLVLALRKSSIFIGALGIWVLCSVSMAVYYMPQSLEEGSAIKLYQKNMFYTGQNKEALKADILNENPDFITFQEVHIKSVNDANLTLISELSTNYTHQYICPNAHVSGVSILSRWPVLKEHCYEGDGIGAIQVKTPNGPLWIISVHLYWPYPHKQGPQVQRALAHIKALKGPKIIAGDFNMVPWSYNMKSIERASDTHIARPIIHSLDLPVIGLRIPIDHVLLPKGTKAKTERRDKFGSDHYGVLVSFTLPES